ncbi:hypothetical protein M404DRAFT_1008573 [Pisolithus tinctorius Marx 270]|uniref:Amine oxidase n=1 Tax=Pisolithus tinctorius Marx 270 TaxID=870435 RepID=A0A0C3NF23_PISTI|nr:hypothetical protein M404DRAFT_1008573 [Pisolithus tinctorius Marx 270]
MSLIRVSVGTVLLSLLAGAAAQGITASQSLANFTQAGVAPNNTKVLILGGGMAGIIAARTLHEQGIDDFVVVDAKTEFGGRMIQKPFGVTGRQIVVEMGPSWIQGTQDGDGNANPVWELAQKHNLSVVESDLYGSVSFFDYTGPSNYSDTFTASIEAFTNATVVAGQRLHENKVDMDLRSAYSYLGMAPTTPQEEACQYYQVDFVYAQSPSQTSWLASAWKHNFTYVPEAGGYSDVHMMSIDPRGIAWIVQAEAVDFLKTNQILYNQTVTSIHYDQNGVTVLTAGGYNLTAEHALVTFSVGVLQNTDVVFQPTLPDWKREAINSIEMAGYNKIFLQFNDTFWFDTEMGLYADLQRGRFPVWQSLDHPDFFPGSGVISVTVTGDQSPYVEQMNTTQLQNEVMEVLRTMYPDAPDPVDIHIPTWGTNALYRGAYSNWGASFVPGHVENLGANVDNHLWFAGEATSLKYFGFLQGAYLEGQRVGKEIADCIYHGSCSVAHEATITNAQPYPNSLQ